MARFSLQAARAMRSRDRLRSIVRRGYVEDHEVEDAEPVGLTDEEVEDLQEADKSVAVIAYSGQDFDVDGLVRRLQAESILIPHYGGKDDRVETAGFQRSFVWSKPQMDRFIESILLGYPIPGIFLVRQLSDKRYLVLDGQQRLTTLRRFKEGLHAGREFVLKNVSDGFKDLTYKSLPEGLQRQFDDTFIQATIVNSDGTPTSLDAIYKIFERVNSGGTQLTAHEVRVALFAGELIAYIAQLNNDPNWRSLYGNESRRLRDHELILRIVALFLVADTYHRPLKTFLNEFVLENRGPVSGEIREAGALFLRACSALNEDVGDGAVRSRSRQVNAALAEAVVVGVMNTLSAAGDDVMPEGLAQAIEQLRTDADFMESVSRSTADEEFVSRRLAKATAAFTAGN